MCILCKLVCLVFIVTSFLCISLCVVYSCVCCVVDLEHDGDAVREEEVQDHHDARGLLEGLLCMLTVYAFMLTSCYLLLNCFSFICMLLVCLLFSRAP